MVNDSGLCIRRSAPLNPPRLRRRPEHGNRGDDSPQVLSEAWEIDVPASMTTEEFYSSDVGFTGDGDYLRVMKLPKADQVGMWTPANFQESPDEWVGTTVITNSNAPFNLEDLNDLKRLPVTKREDGDHLMLCYSKASDNYYSFESIF